MGGRGRGNHLGLCHRQAEDALRRRGSAQRGKGDTRLDGAMPERGGTAGFIDSLPRCRDRVPRLGGRPEQADEADGYRGGVNGPELPVEAGEEAKGDGSVYLRRTEGEKEEKADGPAILVLQLFRTCGK